MVRNCEIKTEETNDRADQAFGLPQAQPKHRSKGQRCRDRQLRISRLTTPGGAWLSLPGSIASSVTQTVTLPRRRSAASYSGQLVTRCRWRGM